MTRRILTGLLLIFLLSCDTDHEDGVIKQETGNVWRSGGLYHCAEQVHLDNGDTLVVGLEEVLAFTSGDRVRVTYREIGLHEFCAPGIACEILEIEKLE